jgi:hypothetical protein
MSSERHSGSEPGQGDRSDEDQVANEHEESTQPAASSENSTAFRSAPPGNYVRYIEPADEEVSRISELYKLPPAAATY